MGFEPTTFCLGIRLLCVTAADLVCLHAQSTFTMSVHIGTIRPFWLALTGGMFLRCIQQQRRNKLL